MFTMLLNEGETYDVDLSSDNTFHVIDFNDSALDTVTGDVVLKGVDMLGLPNFIDVVSFGGKTRFQRDICMRVAHGTLLYDIVKPVDTIRAGFDSNGCLNIQSMLCANVLYEPAFEPYAGDSMVDRCKFIGIVGELKEYDLYVVAILYNQVRLVAYMEKDEGNMVALRGATYGKFFGNLDEPSAKLSSLLARNKLIRGRDFALGYTVYDT